MLPSVQIYEKGERVTVFWELMAGARKFNLYWSKTGSAGSFALLQDNIPNFASLGKKYTKHSFDRSFIGLSISDTFYLAITWVNGTGVESALGIPRIIPYEVDQQADGGALNSPIVTSENISTHVGSSAPQRILFTHDVIFMEIFNNSSNVAIYVDLTGVDATIEKSMPVYPKVYYTIFRNLSKDNGVSIIAAPGSEAADVRIVVHY